MGRMTCTSKENLKVESVSAQIEPMAGKYAIRLQNGDCVAYVSNSRGPQLYDTPELARKAVWRANPKLAAKLQHWEPASKDRGGGR